MKTAGPELQRAVALCILDDLEIACWMQGVPVNPYTIALRWNAGPNRRHFEERHYRYARDVQKAYVHKLRQSPK
jgi:hypothetical protein